MKTCPRCECPYGYESINDLYVCPDCAFEWNPFETNSLLDENKAIDANGNELKDGDTVIIIKDLPVKGAPKPLKAGTKVKNIRLNFNSDHNISCKIEGFGAMGLKSEFVRKV